MALAEGKRLAVIDDDCALAELIGEALEADGFEVSVFNDTPRLFQYIARHGLPHLLVADLKLPSMHGFDLSAKIKAMGDVPIIFISTVDVPETIIAGIEQYADDYLTKPFDVRELVARVRRVLSRIADFSYAQAPQVKIDDWLTIDVPNHCVILRGSEQVTLTRVEAQLLYLLLNHAGATLTARSLIDRIWTFEDVYEDTLRVHIHRLRAKIEPDPSRPTYIRTVRGVGYTFSLPENSPSRPDRDLSIR